jgi:hypothetical protein
MSAPPPVESVFFSTYPYTACKLAGPTLWPSRLKHELEHLAESDWPCWRTLHEWLHVGGVELYTDGSTYITRARSVATAHFLATDRDVWLTCDDDIFAPAGVLRRMVAACRATRAGIALPYLNRDGKSMTFRRVVGPTEWLAIGDGETVPLRIVDRVGFGLVALHREYVLALAKDAPKFSEVDRPGGVRDCPALFLEGVDEGSWVGEDYFFSARAERAGMPLKVLLNAPCSHQGKTALLDEEGVIRVADPAVAQTLDTSLRAREAQFAADLASCAPDRSQGG